VSSQKNEGVKKGRRMRGYIKEMGGSVREKTQGCGPKKSQRTWRAGQRRLWKGKKSRSVDNERETEPPVAGQSEPRLEKRGGGKAIAREEQAIISRISQNLHRPDLPGLSCSKN